MWKGILCGVSQIILNGQKDIVPVLVLSMLIMKPRSELLRHPDFGTVIFCLNYYSFDFYDLCYFTLSVEFSAAVSTDFQMSGSLLDSHSILDD